MSSGGGYSGGMGGFGGGFGQPPMFGGGFGQQFPSYGGGFGAFGPQPYSGFGGGFGGGFGQPQPPQFGGGFDGGFGGGFGQPQPPQFGGGFGQFQQPQFGGGFGQRGPGNAYARPFPQLQPQPAPLPQQQTPPPGMELNPDYIDRFANGQIGTMDYRPSDRRFRPIQQPFDPFEVRPAVMPEVPTGGGYPSRDQFNQTFQLMPAVMPEVPTGGGYPSRDQFSGNTQTFLPTIEPTPAQQNTSVVPSPDRDRERALMKKSFESPNSLTAEDRAFLLQQDEIRTANNQNQLTQVQLQNQLRQQQLSGGLGGMYGGYQAMPFGGYRMFPF
jgi:hypothetical protein